MSIIKRFMCDQCQKEIYCAAPWVHIRGCDTLNGADFKRLDFCSWDCLIKWAEKKRGEEA